MKGVPSMSQESRTTPLLSDLYQVEEKKQGFWRLKGYRNSLLTLVLCLICIQFSFSLLKILSPSVDKQLARWGSSALAGVVQKRELLTHGSIIRSFFSGTLQRQFESWFNLTVPFKSLIIRAYNQFYFQIFSKSYAKNVVIGKKGYLFGGPYNEKYYNSFRKTYQQETFDAWANDLQTLADFFTQRGQQFIYFITPSKSAYYPEFLPGCYRCKKHQARPDYHLMVNTLKRQNIQFVDASKQSLDLKKHIPDYIFPKGGVHWTDLAAAYSAQALVKNISIKGSKEPMPNFTLSYQLRPINGPRRWTSNDADYINLTNLLFPPLDYMVPEVSVDVSQMPQKKLKLVFIGGSFAGQPAKILAQTQLFKQIDVFHYLIIRHDRYTPQGERQEILMKANKTGETPFQIRRRIKKTGVYYPEDYQDLLDADIVILEENEQNLRSNHFKLLFKRMVARRF